MSVRQSCQTQPLDRNRKGSLAKGIVPDLGPVGKRFTDLFSQCNMSFEQSNAADCFNS